MMITEDLIRIQNWYIRSLYNAGHIASTPGARALYMEEARKAKEEFFETYGMELPLCTTTNL